MLWRLSGSMVLSKDFICRYGVSSDVILGEVTDMTPFHNHLFKQQQTAKTTAKTTEVTTEIRRKDATFALG